MNWKEEAINKLRRYDALQRAYKNIPEEIAYLESDAVTIRGRASDCIPVKGIVGKREDALISNLVEREELKISGENVRRILNCINSALAVLTPEEKIILHRLYICPEPKALDRLISDLGKEKSSIYRKRDEALLKFTIAMYGSADSI